MSKVSADGIVCRVPFRLSKNPIEDEIPPAAHIFCERDKEHKSISACALALLRASGFALLYIKKDVNLPASYIRNDHIAMDGGWKWMQLLFFCPFKFFWICYMHTQKYVHVFGFKLSDWQLVDILFGYLNSVRKTPPLFHCDLSYMYIHTYICMYGGH